MRVCGLTALLLHLSCLLLRSDRSGVIELDAFCSPPNDGDSKTNLHLLCPVCAFACYVECMATSWALKSYLRVLKDSVTLSESFLSASLKPIVRWKETLQLWSAHFIRSVAVSVAMFSSVVSRTNVQRRCGRCLAHTYHSIFGLCSIEQHRNGEKAGGVVFQLTPYLGLIHLHVPLLLDDPGNRSVQCLPLIF